MAAWSAGILPAKAWRRSCRLPRGFVKLRACGRRRFKSLEFSAARSILSVENISAAKGLSMNITFRILTFVSLIALAGCASAIPRYRTLPEWVETVAIPMFENESAQPGIEEVGARYAVEEFLADGRLMVDSVPNSDVVVRVRILDYSASPVGFSDDEFPETTMIAVVASVKLFEPSVPGVPFADLGTVKTDFGYISDYRRTFMTPENTARDGAMRNLAKMVLNRVISEYTPTGQDEYEKSLEPGAPRGLPAKATPDLEPIRDSIQR
jgi:hypothetical protein